MVLMKGRVAIVGYGETPYTRPRAERGQPRLTAEEYASWAMELALSSAGLSKSDFDGQGLGVTGTIYPHAEIWSAEVAQNLGITPKMIIRADQGGAAAASLLIQGALAINAGLVDMFLCIAADAPLSMPTASASGARTWRYENDYMLPFGMMGPNSIFAFIMKRHMHQYGTKREHTGKIAITQRYHASMNPVAYLKAPMTMDEYLSSRVIADPIHLLDCCIPVNGGLAFILASKEKAKQITDKPVYLLGFGECHNYTHGSKNRPDITYLGIVKAAPEAYKMAGIEPKDASFVEIYDDYTIAVLMQLEDLGFCKKGEGGKFVEQTDISIHGQLPVNTHGGQLSAGQAGIGGGCSHIVEAARQLREEAGQRQVKDAKIGVVTAIGGLAYGVNLVHNAVMVFGKEV